MRVGIITVHKSTVNYGASLQCFSLYRYLSSSLIIDCEVIDLKRPCHKRYIPSKSFGEKKHVILQLKTSLNDCFRHRNKGNRDKLFDCFNNLIKYSREYRSVQSIYDNPPQYDVYISGSDQIWNPNMPFVNAPYFLDFVHGVKKISYASSLGIEIIDNEEIRKNYVSWLSEYGAISVREKSAVSLLHSISINNVTQVLDPVFLTTKAEWISLMPTERLIREDYTFIYFLSYDEKFVKRIDYYIRNTNKKVVLVMSDDSSVSVSGAVQLREIGPLEWLNLLYFANEIITDSFHATCFSLIFEKSFGVIINKEKKTNSRIIDVLTLLHLENGVNEINEKDIKLSLIDNKGLSVLESEIKRSKTFLKSALGI